MKMVPLHQSARKLNYYVRMFTKELMDEIDYVIKNSADDSVPKRLTKSIAKSDDLKVYVDKLKVIHSEKDDDVLCEKLNEFISSVSNNNLSGDWETELKQCVRVYVPDDKVPWKVKFEYEPTNYTAWPVLHTTLDPSSPKPPWADEDFTLK